MEIIDFKDICIFENEILNGVKENNNYKNIIKKAECNNLKYYTKINRFIENGKYHSDIVIEILSQSEKSLSEKDEPLCNIMLCETICFSKKNKLIKNNLLMDMEFFEEMDNLLHKLNNYIV